MSGRDKNKRTFSKSKSKESEPKYLSTELYKRVWEEYQKALDGWITDRLPEPETEILACVRIRRYGMSDCYIATVAVYEDGTIYADDSDFSFAGGFDEKTQDRLKVPRGWYELHYYDDEMPIAVIEDVVTGWMPIIHEEAPAKDDDRIEAQDIIERLDSLALKRYHDMPGRSADYSNGWFDALDDIRKWVSEEAPRRKA